MSKKREYLAKKKVKRKNEEKIAENEGSERRNKKLIMIPFYCVVKIMNKKSDNRNSQQQHMYPLLFFLDYFTKLREFLGPGVYTQKNVSL